MLQKIRKNLEELHTEEAKERRKIDARQLSIIARTGTAEAIPIGLIDTAVDKYSVVAQKLYFNFIAKEGAKRFASRERQGVNHGYRVLARLAKWGVQAYRQEARVKGRLADPEELGTTLRESYNPLVVTFSAVSGDINKILEDAFGLLSDEHPRYESLPYRVVGDEKSATGHKVVPSPYTFEQLIIDGKLPDSPPQTLQGCLASGRMLKQAWGVTISTCVEDPRLFSADLSE